MDLLAAVHHPLFQSVILPLLLSLLGVGVLRTMAGAGPAVCALGLAFLLSVVWMTGWPTPPATILQRLPWIFALAWLAGVTLAGTVGNRLLHGLVLAAAWLAASWWLGVRDVTEMLLFPLGGVLVIAGLLRASEERAEAATLVVVAGLGLAGLAFAAGSLMLFQFSLMLAAAVGGVALWQWPRPRIRFGVAGIGVAAISWLALAQSALLLTPASPIAVALLCFAFSGTILSAPLLGRLPAGHRDLAAPLVLAVLAGAFVAAALLLQDITGNDSFGGKSDASANDPYYAR